jgi:mono/diheme cytochrome c family protein
MCKPTLRTVVVFWFCLTTIALAQQKQLKHVPVQQTSPRSGPEMYANYCAACHGKDGKGNGPAADALKSPPADLTILALHNGGKYPSERVSSAIVGDLNLPAHGSKDMPIWGDVFWRMSGGRQSEVQLRVANLDRYIESLQGK